MSKKMLAPYIGDGGAKTVREEDLKHMTHVFYAFGVLVDGKVTIDHLKNVEHVKNFKNINPDLKLILSIGGWSAGGFSKAAFTEQGRKLFAKTSIAIVKKHGFDGLDIDWEYPSSSQARIDNPNFDYHPQDKKNFTLLLKELREGLDELSKETGKDYILSIAVGAEQYYVDGTEMDKVQQYLDFVMLMSYDTRGGFYQYAGHHTNLGYQNGKDEGPSALRTIRIFNEAGVPKEKMVLGAAFYARMWTNVYPENNGLGQPAESFGNKTIDYPKLVEEYINKNGFTRYWDEAAKAPYLFDGHNFISYDDEESLKSKCEFVKNTELAGIMFWEYPLDTTYTLFDCMVKNMKD